MQVGWGVGGVRTYAVGGLRGILALASVEFTAAAGWHLVGQSLWVGVGLRGLLVDGVRVSRHGGED